MPDRPGGGNHATSALPMQDLLSGGRLYDGINVGQSMSCWKRWTPLTTD